MKHRVLDIQRITGAEEAYRSFTANAVIVTRDAAGTLPLRLEYTPPVDCWWKVTFHISIVEANFVDAWRWCYGRQKISPSPNNNRSGESDGPVSNLPTGTSASSIVSQVGSDYFHNRKNIKLWDLSAGITYTVTGEMSQGGGGNWYHHCGQDHLWMHGIAIEK